MANLKGWLNSGWEKISCTIIGNKVALDVVPRDADGGVLGGSDAPSHTVIVDENGPINLSFDEDGNLQTNPGNRDSDIDSIGVEGKYEAVTFQDAITTTGNGTVLDVKGYKTLMINIYGTATARTIVFEGVSSSGNYISIQGVNMATNVIASTTTGTSEELWQFDITGLIGFRCRCSAVSGGNLSLKGRVVG